MGNFDPTIQELTLSKQPIADSVLDSILVCQFVVAWAGESLCEPSRLGWWRTDLIDKDGGGDFLQRLLPKTYLWASLEAVREAAIQADQQKRQRLAQADEVNTLFFWGFEIDERLQDRLAVHKRGQKAPADCLDFPLELGAEFSLADLETVLAQPGGKGYEVVSEGRAIKGNPPQSEALRAKYLAAALLPFKDSSDSYPMPFYPMGANHGK